MSALCACEAQLQPHDPVEGVCPLRGSGRDLDAFLAHIDREVSAISWIGPNLAPPSRDNASGHAIQALIDRAYVDLGGEG